MCPSERDLLWSTLRSHAFTQPALAFVGSRDPAFSALPPQRIAL